MKKRIFCALCILFFMGSLIMGTNYQVFMGNTNVSTTKIENNQSLNSNDIVPSLPSQIQKNFTFAGQNKVDSVLYFQGASLLTSNTNKDIKIMTHNWNISNILVNFTNIHRETLLHIENITPPHSFMMIYNSSKGPTINIFAMELKMPLPSFIFNLKLYLYYGGNLSLFTVIYSATSGGGGRPTPKSPVLGYSAISEYKSLTTYGSGSKTEWVEFKFNPRTLKDFLNPITTVNTSFFVVLGVISGGSGPSSGGKGFLHWGFNLDNPPSNPNSGLVYKYSGNSWVEYTGIDFLLENVSFSTLTWQNTFNVEPSIPVGNKDYILIYSDSGVVIPNTQDNAQQFQTNANSYLSNLTAYLQYLGKLSVWAEVYNATKSSISGKPIPHKFLFKSETVNLTNLLLLPATAWVSFRFLTDRTLNSSFLNLQNTYNYSFFVVLKAIGGQPMAQDYVNWGFMTDVFNGDQGLAYYWNQSQRPEYWTLFSPGIDLCLVNISLISYEYNPSRVNLRINLTFFVKDYLLFSFGGSILLTGPFNGANGIIFLDTMADFTVYYQAIWSCWYYNQTKAFVLFKGNSLTNTVEWNMTISTKYPVWDSSIQGVGKYSLRLMNFSLPTDYSVSQVYFNYISYSSWGTIKLKDKQILIILGNTGNWLIRMYSPNYVEEVHAFNGPKELNQFYVGNLLNVTAKLKALTNVAANLTIYNISNKILRNETQIPNAYWAKFNLWPIPQNDSLYLVVFWANGTEVGIRSLEIMCVYHTRLTKNSPDANTDLGLITGTSPIKIGVFYNDTDNKVGIPSATITVNITPYGVVEYDSLSHPGYYNLTISTSLLINGNWTAKIQANRRGYNISDLFIQFQLRIGKNATLSVVGGCRWQAGRWWLNPNPYFDDTSHKVTVFYANGTSPYEGIQYAQVVGKPNWTSTFWYGIPTNISPGFYDISINTAGLHEADIGRVDFTAYSPYFETKLVNISLIIVEIPAILLSMDAGVYQNITCYEGESFGIAVGYWDEFHSKPILFENPTQGNLTWQIIGTAAYGTLQKSVWQYEGTISLPAWGILGTKTYNLEITATALRDYAIYEKNLTLNVKSKENTTLLLTISTSGEYRVGNSFYIFANLTFENKTPLINTKVDFNITLWHQGLWNGSLFDSRVTNTMGIATYYYSEIPNGIDQIRINVTYEGTPQIDPVTSWLYISVLPKYNVSLLLSNFTLHKYRVGQDLYLLATLRLEDGSYLSNQPIIFNISFYNGINLIQRIIETRFTDLLGNISYYIGSIPDLTNILIYSASFTETKTILGCINRTIIPIGPKYNISLTIISQIPQEIMVGNTLELEALLLNEETKIGLANETIEFILIFDKNNTITRFATTDAQGHAIIELLIPNDKSNYDSFKIEVRYAGSAIFKNATYTAANSVTIMTWTKIIINLLPYIGIAIAIIIGSYLSYRQFVAVPRRRRRQAHIEKIASKYSDLINLQHILVIHSTTGSCIYQHSFGEVTFDPDLLSGFLTAISAFESELKIPTPSKPLLSEKLPHKEEASRGFELNYANFKVLLNVGHLTRTALILTTSASENLRKSLGEFVDKFEERYKGDLIDWKGAMAPFRSADQLVETTFETNLLWPHIIESISEDRMKALNSLESSLVTLALTMQREKQYFFLPALVPMVEKVRHTPMVEILGSIDDLRHKGIFKAISIEELERRLQQGATNSNTKT